MAKKTPAVKKAATKKTVVKKAATKTTAGKKTAAKTASTGLGRKAPARKSAAAKKAAVKKASPKKSASKKELSEKEAAQREANKIINSSPKNKGKKPVKVRSNNENSGLLDAIVEGLQEKKAKNIVVLDLTKLSNPVTDYFVVADADSRTHVEAIADSVEEVVGKKTGEKPYHSEGHQVGEWILVDYINIVVHVFQKETREYYNIEALWADAEVTKYES
ncbi:MAG: rsfS [Bacteroidetes bacterium]|jgi:ribosome-associated protein|nr:rsfS [Bacteroidota bacterium]